MNVILAFPGQGSQHPQMFEDIPAQDALPRLLDAAGALSGVDVAALAKSALPEQLTDTRVAQPLIYLCDWAWGRSVLAHGVVPALLAGHSVGEFAALAIGGVFSAEAGLELVCARAAMMAEAAYANPGAMSAVLGLDADQVDRVIAGIDNVWLANDNSDGQAVISGSSDAVARAESELVAAGARRVVRLDVSGPFHTPLMRPAAERFAELLQATEFRDARYPVSQNTRPEPTKDGEAIRSALIAQLDGRVRWREVMQVMATHDSAVMIECGPGAVLTGLARRIDEVRAFPSDRVRIETIVKGLA